MGKNRQTRPQETGKRAGKAGHVISDKRNKQDGKPKKNKPVDHINQIPFRLREIMKSKERMKQGKKKTKAVPPKDDNSGPRSDDIPVPRFRRKDSESVKAYVRRMDHDARHVMFLTKNQVERKPELEEDVQERAANAGKSEKRKEYNKARLQKLHQKKLKRQEDEMEREMYTDKVNFGEVAMAPPSLSVKPKKAQIKSTNASKGLLLTSLLGQSRDSAAKPSMARQRIMEEERQRAVEAYRRLKKQKQQQQQQEGVAVSLERLQSFE